MAETTDKRERFKRTQKQREFRRFYWEQTGFDFIDDTTVPFSDRVRWNVNWYEDHTKDVHLRISDAGLKIIAEDTQ